MQVIRRRHVNRIIDVELTAVLRLPTEPRTKRGLGTVCHACGRMIVCPEFIAGFAKGQPNMMFHELCLDESAKALLAEHDAK